MKIYNSITFCMATGEILSEDSFEYNGQIALCGGGGGTTVQAPQPSAEEIALQKEQLAILQQQRAESELMKPYVLSGMGLTEEDGQLRKLTEEELTASMTDVEKSQYGLIKKSQERQLQAYEGTLPISPALEADLVKQQEQLNEALSQRLGPNWQLTTPGQQAMGEFTKRADLVREEARRGAISTEGGLLLSNLGYLGQTQAQKTTETAQFPSRTSGLFSGYVAAQQPYQQQRQMEYQANLANAQMNAGRSAGLMGGLGSLAGAGLQAYGTYKGLALMAAAKSSREFKKEIEKLSKKDEEKALKSIKKSDVYSWKYKEEDDNVNPHIGFVTEEAPESIVTKDKKHIDIVSHLGLLAAATKSLAGKVDKLERRGMMIHA